MNRTMTKTSLAIILSLSAGLTVVADQEYLEIDSFEGIEIGTGMIGTVSCGSENTVTLSGDKKDLDHLEINVHGGKLEISRRTSTGKILSNIFGDHADREIKIEITTSGPISNIEASTGSSLSIPECAVNNSFFEVDAGTGATVNIEGTTSTLDLDLSTGSTFNRSDSNFTVDTANVDLSTGATAGLCGAATVNGSASTGATISASENANTENVSLSFSAEVHTKRCR